MRRTFLLLPLVASLTAQGCSSHDPAEDTAGSGGTSAGGAGHGGAGPGGAAGHGGSAGKADAGTGGAGSGQAGKGQAGSGPAGGGQAGSGQAGKGQAGSGNAGSGAGGQAGGSPEDLCGGKVVRPDGSIDAEEYGKQARAWGTEIINCRLGPDFTAYHGAGAPDMRPTAYKPPDQKSEFGRNGAGMTYQLGGPGMADSMNDFGSVIDQVLYVPDADLNPGLDRISTFDWSNHVIVEMPEKVWWGTPACWWPDCKSNPDPAGQLAPWAMALGHPVRRPLAAARQQVRWANDALVIFQDGLIGATGSQTSDDHHPYFQFPPNKVPTAIATTSYNEFALVTIWDTDTQQGQVAVLALEGKGLASATHGWYYIGFPSVGSYTNIKLLGYLDLPGMATPTAIGASSDSLGVGGMQLGLHKLDTQAGRDEFATGQYARIPALSGYAVVASKWQNKAAFIDLQPLFEYMRAMYVTTQANFDLTQAAGPGPDQWPYAFSSHPEQMPTVLTTLPVAHPNALLLGRHRYYDTATGKGTFTKAFIASLDGTVTAYDVTSLGWEGPAQPSDVKALFTVKVGQNPTSLSWPRNSDPKDPQASPYEYNNSFLAVSRGDREIDWVTSNETSGTVFRRFTDSRLEDPVDLDVGERAYVMAVADWKGKKIVTYRFAPTPADAITPHQSFGLGPDGQGDAECGGVLSIEGYPFRLSSTNVN
jgi:hypothetical protein